MQDSTRPYQPLMNTALGAAPYAPYPATTTAAPRARPLFRGGKLAPANAIRGYWAECCCGLRPGTGSNVPPHWFDGGLGWTTAHFFDLEPFDAAAQAPGRHQCKYCGFVAEGEECCGKGACWWPLARAPSKMVAHLTAHHGIAAPPKRQWATECTDFEGLLDAIFCWPCQASRQINAAHGKPDQINVFWCLYFTMAMSHPHHDESGRIIRTGLHFLAAFITRNSIKQLNRIDEDCCTTLLMALCCPCCSLAQTYREFTAAGVWPGDSVMAVHHLRSP